MRVTDTGQARSTLRNRWATGRGCGRRGGRTRRLIAGLVAVVIGLTAAFVPSLIDPRRAAAAWLDPIDCSRLYAVGQHGTAHHVYTVDPDRGTLTVNNTVSLAGWSSLNGLAVDLAGDAFWMVGQQADQTSTTIVRVDATTGTRTAFRQELPGAPARSGGLVMGALDPDSGIYYFGLVSTSGLLTVWGFDTRSERAVPGVIGRVALGTGRGGDFAIDSRGRMYVVSQGVLLVLDEPIPGTGSPSPGRDLTASVITTPPEESVGALAFGPDGYLHVAGRRLHRLDPSTGRVAGSTDLGTGRVTVGDLASCAAPNLITLVKDLPEGRARPGDQFALAITGGDNNVHEGVTSGNDPGVQDRTPAAVAGPALGLPGSMYTITETAAGATDLGRYRSSWQCVDRVTGDEVAAGTGTSGRFALPNGPARGVEIRCAFRNRPRGTGEGTPDLTMSKTVDPVSGSVVTAGQSVGYRLSLRNSGTAAAVVDVDEVIAAVLDDAAVTAEPVSSDPALQVSAVAGGRFTISGRLAAGDSATVEYTVRVEPDGRRGDDVLGTHLVEAGADPPAGCQPSNLLCTQNPVPAIEATVGVDPEDGTPVGAGRLLTYTLGFGNTGAAPAAVGFDAVLADVLDDAAIERQPTASDPGLTVSALTGDRFTVSGTVKPGRTATVRYTVRVRPDRSRGDDRLVGFLIQTGGEVPDECRPAGTTCTANPVGG